MSATLLCKRATASGKIYICTSTKIDIQIVHARYLKSMVFIVLIYKCVSF